MFFLLCTFNRSPSHTLRTSFILVALIFLSISHPSHWLYVYKNIKCTWINGHFFSLFCSFLLGQIHTTLKESTFLLNIFYLNLINWAYVDINIVQIPYWSHFKAKLMSATPLTQNGAIYYLLVNEVFFWNVKSCITDRSSILS